MREHKLRIHDGEEIIMPVIPRTEIHPSSFIEASNKYMFEHYGVEDAFRPLENGHYEVTLATIFYLMNKKK